MQIKTINFPFPYPVYTDHCVAVLRVPDLKQISRCEGLAIKFNM